MGNDTMTTIWPDHALEKKMVDDAHFVTYNGAKTIAADCGCHVLALLSRIRDLEKEAADSQAREKDLSSRLSRTIIALHGESDGCDADELARECMRERDRVQALLDQYHARELKLLALLNDLCDHAEDSGRCNLANEIRRKIQEAIK